MNFWKGKKRNAENLARELQMKRIKIITFCTTCPGNLTWTFSFSWPFLGQEKEELGSSSSRQIQWVSVLSSLGRMLFLMNTEDTSPSRWRTTTHMMCSYSAHPAMPSPITMTTTSSSSWPRSLGLQSAPRKVCVSWRTLCAGKCARGRAPCWMQTACLTPEGQSCCKASRTSITQTQSLQRCSRQQLVWKPGIASPCRLDVRFLVVYIAFLTGFVFVFTHLPSTHHCSLNCSSCFFPSFSSSSPVICFCSSSSPPTFLYFFWRTDQEKSLKDSYIGSLLFFTYSKFPQISFLNKCLVSAWNEYLLVMLTVVCKVQML